MSPTHPPPTSIYNSRFHYKLTRHYSLLSPASRSDERIALEKVLTTKLREVMLHQDLEEVTCKQLRLLLEGEMNMDLTDYRGFLDQQMLRILGQMERPSQIFEYLYLVSGLDLDLLVIR